MLTGNCDLNNMVQEKINLNSSCQNKTSQTAICKHNEQYIRQTGCQFGFVPQTDLKLHNGESVHWETVPDVMQSHHIIRSSGFPNFLKCRIPVNTNLNIKNCRYYTKSYWDQQLPDLLQYGFPLDFDRNCKLQSVDSNHKSAEVHMDQVRSYIKEELSQAALIGPFDRLPPSFHTSPLMTRDKQDSNKKRTIMDLSWPKGASVNDDLYLGAPYTLHYPSVDNITAALHCLGPGAQLFKIDISMAFCHIRVDPADTDLLGLQVDQPHFVDVSTPFRYQNGSLFFQHCSNAIRCIVASHGFPDLYNYIDDLMYVGLPSKIDAAFQFLLSLLADLSLEVSTKKLVPLSTSVICLGILIF